MRLPRLSPCWRRQRTFRLRKKAWRLVTWSSTRQSLAVRSAARIRRSCRRAAPAAPRRGMRRVFTRPASGARAKTMTTLSARIGVLARQALRRDAERIEKAQPPHEKNSAQHAARLPAAPRGADALAQARRPPAPLQQPAERDVFHHGDLRKSREHLPSPADPLIPGRDAGEARSEAHRCRHRLEEPVTAFALAVEAPPARALERLQNQPIRARRQTRIGVQEHDGI